MIWQFRLASRRQLVLVWHGLERIIWMLEGSLSSWLTYMSSKFELGSASARTMSEGPWFLSTCASLRAAWTSSWQGFQEQAPQGSRQQLTVPCDLVSDVTQDHVYLHLPQKKGKTCFLKARWTWTAMQSKAFQVERQPGTVITTWV